jgi:hypothetical protein
VELFDNAAPAGSHRFAVARKRCEAVPEILSCESLSDAQLARLACGLPYGLEEEQFRAIIAHPNFGTVTAVELAKAWTCLGRSYAQSDEFANSLSEMPLAQVAIALSRHWWFSSEWFGHDEVAKQAVYADLVARTMALGEIGLELVCQLCLDAEAAADCVPADNHHVFSAVEAAQAAMAPLVNC